MLTPFSTPPASLFWSAPPERDSDFTAEDPLALDYLGQQVGNWMFPGFTTRTGRAQYYLVVLYGLELVDRAVRHYGYSGDDATRIKLFERWERFWALACFESRAGDIGRGHHDAMRGVRGARRAWRPGQRELELDFPMITRQSELAGLGAYLSSLRYHRLVIDASLRPSLTARELTDHFWSDAETHSRSHLYTRYALEALDLGRPSIPRKRGAVKLAKVGAKTRLSSIRQTRRAGSRERLWRILFEDSRDASTLALAHQLIRADKEEVSDPEELIAGMCAGRWGELDEPERALVDFAQAFGELAVSLLEHFNQVYATVADAGGVTDADRVAEQACAGPEAEQLGRRCRRLLDHPEPRRFRELRFHGPPLLRLCADMDQPDPHRRLEALLSFHRRVQRSRRGGGAWIRPEGPKLTLQIDHYNGHKAEVAFPSFKLWTIRGLLGDLGRLR